MPATQYPFIDIAVHERVRDHYADGDAIVLFSADMSAVLWSNGRGARLFGYDSVYDFLDQGPHRHDLLFRQVESAGVRAGRSGAPEPLTIRVSAGFRAVAVSARCMPIELAGEAAVLFTAPVGGISGYGGGAGAGLIEGLDDPDIHVAVLGPDGIVTAASKQFPTLGLTPHTAQMLVTIANNEPSRRVKRPVPTSRGYLPAAMGRLCDDPALYLLLVVETAAAGMDLAPEAGRSDPLAAVELKSQDSDSFDAAIDAVAHIREPADPEEVVAFDLVPVAVEEEEVVADEAAAIPASAGAGHETKVSEAPDDAQATAMPEAPARVVPEPAPPPSHDDFVFRGDGRATRFVWKIDAEGRFQEISEEFARAVGPRSASIGGETFASVSARFGLDPENKLQDLLRRRDTWSGKTIWWPVEGTSLRVPIDLAALPTYTRDRVFDGFRGFGIIRVSDAVEDPDALGMALVPGGRETDAETPEELEDAAPPVSGVAEHPTIEAPAEEDDTAVEVATADEDGSDNELFEDASVPAEEMDAAPLPELPEDEKPVLRVVENLAPANTDKVVQLPDRRIRREGLSPVEQAAFREIARQLDGFIGRQGPVEAEAGGQDGAESSSEEFQEPTRTEAHPPEERAPPIDEQGLPDDGTAADAATPEAVQETPVAAEEPSEPGHRDPEADQGDAEDGDDTRYLPAARERMGLTGEILDQMPVALLVHVGDRLIHANPEFLRLTGYPSIEALADVGGLDALLQRQDLESADEQASGLVLVRADDRIVPVTARLQSVRFEDATALMLAMIPTAAEPATERDRPLADVIPLARPVPEQAARLQVEVEELRAILETATDGVVVIDVDGTIRSMNQAASALFNYDNDETEGKPFVMLFAHESQKAILDYLGMLSGHGVGSVLNDGREVIGREASGGFIPLFMTIGRLTSSNGFCAVIRDVTQWKRTEEELRTAKRAAEAANAHKSEFLAHVSHEIRTPLNAIIGFADMMATEHFGPVGHPRYVEYAGDIVRSGRHVLDIVNDLLDISKIEAGEMELDFVAVELNETVSESVSLLQPQANGQRVIIRTALSHSVPQVVADLRSVKQIVINILSNAIRFTPSGGQIVVSTAYESNGSVALRIRDTGIGMTREELELAMKPFRQVAGGTRKRGDGTGLGLPLTKAMVDANRATFAISSTPREGTLVEITFSPQRVLAK
ncbi:ATP-binding protein [Pseudorhizobium sp. NPDC055634]